MFDIQNYHKAKSVAEAAKLLSQNPGAKIILGGTDVLVKLRHFDDNYHNLVDIHDLPELKKVKKQSDGSLYLGAGLTFAETINCPEVLKMIPVLAESAATVAGPQIRSMGTIGGNIANGATSADSAAPMLILEPELLIVGSSGERRTSILGFHTGPGKVSLAADEVLAAFIFSPEKIDNFHASYYKYAMRKAMDIATIGCAAGVRLDGAKLSDLRIALTVAAPTPIRCPAAEEAGRGQTLTDKVMADILKALEGDIRPRDSWRAPKAFRERIIKVLVERMIKLSVERAKGKGKKK